MSHPQLALSMLAGTFAVHRFAARVPVPRAALKASFFAIARNSDELSIVVPASIRLESERVERGWACFKVNGPLDLGMLGVMAAISTALAAAKVSLFAISTYDTDYVLVKAAQAARARQALRRAGFTFTRSSRKP